jgi:hypothetical protein
MIYPTSVILYNYFLYIGLLVMCLDKSLVENPKDHNLEVLLIED